jgi:hypothetical protein
MQNAGFNTVLALPSDRQLPRIPPRFSTMPCSPVSMGLAEVRVYRHPFDGTLKELGQGWIQRRGNGGDLDICGGEDATS